MNTRHRSGRRIATVVALAAGGAVTAGVIVGTASAAGTGTCTADVNVRSEPSASAPVVGTCKEGRSTRVGETRNGFVQLDEFGGWASAQYVREGSGAATAPNQARPGESESRPGGDERSTLIGR